MVGTVHVFEHSGQCTGERSEAVESQVESTSTTGRSKSKSKSKFKSSKMEDAKYSSTHLLETQRKSNSILSTPQTISKVDLNRLPQA